MAEMTARELIARARECADCGKPHERRMVDRPWRDGSPGTGPSWADPADGHPYRRRVGERAVEQLEQIAAGEAGP